jgi:hypothetical protein
LPCDGGDGIEVFRRHGLDGSRPAGLDDEHAEKEWARNPGDEDSPHGCVAWLKALPCRDSREQVGSQIPLFAGAESYAECRAPKGATGTAGECGHKLSANGLEQPTCLEACWSFSSPWFAAVRVVRRMHIAVPELPGFIRHPLPCRDFAFPSSHSMGSGCQAPPDGKVRWQKRFVFPARRMRRGWRF